VGAMPRGIRLRQQTTVERLGGPVNDRFVLIERGIEKNGDPGQTFESFKQAPVEGIGGATHRLESPGAVYVRDRRDQAAHFGPDRVYLHHEGVRHAAGEVILQSLFDYGWRERPELFPKLDLR